MPSPRIVPGVVLAALVAAGALTTAALTPNGAAGAEEAPARPLLRPDEPLEASLAPGDQTGQRFVAAFVPDRNGPWTVYVETPRFNASLEIRRRAAGGSTESLGRVRGFRVINPALTVEAAARDALEVIVEGDETHACGAAFRLTVRAGPRPARTEAEKVEASRRYWADLLADAQAKGDSACEVRALLGQHAKVRREGHLDEATGLVDQAIATAQERIGPASPFLAWSLNAKGRLLREETRVDEALPLLERAESMLEARYGQRHPVTADALADLAGLYGALDRDEEAAALYKRVFEIREETLPPGDLDLGASLTDLAISSVQAGDLAGASILMERVVAMTEAQVPQDPEDVSAALGSLAYVQRRLGDDEAARRTYERALELLRTNVPTARKPIARLSGLLGRVLDDLGDEAAARELYEQALAIDLDIYGKDHATPASIELRLARLDARAGRFDTARERAAKAVAVFETTLGPRHSRTANALLAEAEIERMAGGSEKALALVDRALDVAEALLGPAHPDLAGPLRLRAAIDIDLGRGDAALAAALRAEELGRDQLWLAALALAEAPALRYAATRPRGLDLALRLAAGATTPSPDLDRMAWDSLIRSRALVLDAMARRRLLLASGDPEVERLRGDLARASSRLARLLVRAAEGDPPGDILAQIEAARRERDRSEQSLAATSAAFQSGRREETAGFDAIARVLGPGEALMSYVRIDLAAGGVHRPGTPFEDAAPDEAYVALVMRGAAGPPRLVRLGSAATVDAAVERWRSALARAPQGLGSSRAALERARRDAGAALRGAIWDPIVPALGAEAGAPPVATLFVVPDGALDLVNLAALPVGGDRYLVEMRPAIRMLSAERDLAAAADAGTGAGRALVVGGPDFDAGPGAVAAHLFPPLPEASAEAGDVAASLRRAHVAQVSLLTGAGATEEAFKRLAPRSRYLHVATHAFWNAAELAPRPAGAAATTGRVPLADAVVHGADNPLDLSGVALAGANRRAPRGSVSAQAGTPPPDDGILTADEVATLDLSTTAWVVLSGCDTGLAETAPGEGLLGLQRAFRVAGARGLVVSLWQVPDVATREWMKLVYAEARAGASPANALGSAARKWLAAERHAGAPTSPEVWGAFIATGTAR
ncbi:MAG TPA: CHAT domain-containing tetratricopeptide repeat protein [Patescibacteria group bacterium]|nr:CHAT domain-containing tetratricopeptide repeat protein [Patescibacteria group bacterium]